MTIRVLDTAGGMRTALAAAHGEREDALRDVLAPMAGMYRYFPGEIDLASMHALSFGFPLAHGEERSLLAIEQLESADAWTRVGQALDAAVAVQCQATPDLQVPDITVLLVLGNPSDAYFIGPARGFSGNGSATGFISLTVWPTQENVDRLEAAAVHELNHNLRYAPGGAVWDPAVVTVGEQVVSEGLADAFARQLYGPAGYTPIGREHLHDQTVFDHVVSGLDVTGMENFTAWVHGDQAARRFGTSPVGLPTGAGYAAGNRLVDAYLDATGKTAAESLHVPSSDVIGAAMASR